MEKLTPMPIELVLTHKKQLTHDVIELHFEPKTPFLFYPGQFVNILVPPKEEGGRGYTRAYSIASAPELTRDGKAIVELCIKIVEGGPGTQYLNRLAIGEKVNSKGPYGHFVYKSKPNRHVVMISTGTGIAPFRAMVYSQVYLDQKPLSTHLLFGARETHDLLYVDELNHAMGKAHFVKVLSKTKEEFDGFKGRVTDWLRHHADKIHWRETDFYICGNGAMIDEVKAILAEREVEKTAIFQEVYYKVKTGESHANQ